MSLYIEPNRLVGSVTAGSLAFVEKIKRELGVKQLTVGTNPEYYVELLNVERVKRVPVPRVRQGAELGEKKVR